MRMAESANLPSHVYTFVLRAGNQIRLTPVEIARFQRITGFAPEVTSIAELSAYAARCKRYFGAESGAARFLRWAIDREVDLCLSGRLAQPL